MQSDADRLKGKVRDALDKTDVDEKVKAKAEKLKDKIRENQK